MWVCYIHIVFNSEVWASSITITQIAKIFKQRWRCTFTLGKSVWGRRTVSTKVLRSEYCPSAKRPEWLEQRRGVVDVTSGESWLGVIQVLGILNKELDKTHTKQWKNAATEAQIYWHESTLHRMTADFSKQLKRSGYRIFWGLNAIWRFPIGYSVTSYINEVVARDQSDWSPFMINQRLKCLQSYTPMQMKTRPVTSLIGGGRGQIRGTFHFSSEGRRGVLQRE